MWAALAQVLIAIVPEVIKRIFRTSDEKKVSKSKEKE